MELNILSAVNNRKRLKQLLPDSLIFLKGREDVIRTNDSFYPFRQYSDFLYLTGIEKPKYFIVLTPSADYLFIPKSSLKHVVWLGLTETVKAAKDRYGFQKVYYEDKFDNIFAELLRQNPLCFTDKTSLPFLHKFRTLMKCDIRKLKHSLTELRSLKSEYEIRLIKHISAKTGNAFKKIMKTLKPGLNEYAVQGIFENELFNENIRATAFPTIVAGGTNSAILHYQDNGKILKDRELCLIDAGGEYKGYAADITRTLPVNGKFTEKQKRIYNIVLKAQLKCIENIKPRTELKDIHTISTDVIINGLYDLKILKGSIKDILASKTYRLFYPHGISHMLGLDTHDVFIPLKRKKKSGELRANFILKPFSVITVEPGIYFNKTILKSSKIRKKYSKTVNWEKTDEYINFGGIRIEDDVLVTEKGCTVLTDVPKTPEDIEQMMQKRN